MVFFSKSYGSGAILDTNSWAFSYKTYFVLIFHNLLKQFLHVTSHFTDLFFGIKETILKLTLLRRSDKIPLGTGFILTSISEECRPSQSIVWGRQAYVGRRLLVTLHQQSGSRDRKWV